MPVKCGGKCIENFIEVPPAVEAAEKVAGLRVLRRHGYAALLCVHKQCGTFNGNTVQRLPNSGGDYVMLCRMTTAVCWLAAVGGHVRQRGCVDLKLG